MPLETMTITESGVSARGGVAGDQVTVPGSGFGSVAGIVRFDPLGENVQAVLVSWVPNQVVFTVPALATGNRTVTVQIENSTAGDSVSMPFWYPSTPIAEPLHQWPNAEAGGAEQDIDIPRIFSAADFNRVLDKLRQVSGLAGSALSAAAHALTDHAGIPGAGVQMQVVTGTIPAGSLANLDLPVGFSFKTAIILCADAFPGISNQSGFNVLIGQWNQDGSPWQDPPTSDGTGFTVEYLSESGLGIRVISGLIEGGLRLTRGAGGVENFNADPIRTGNTLRITPGLNSFTVGVSIGALLFK